MNDYAAERKEMVRDQIARRGLREARLVAAFESVPRHLFVPPDYRHLAYADGPLPIGWGQTISQPYIVALMTSLLELRGGERVLEVGTGSGYQAAILSHLAAEVHTMEWVPELGVGAEKMLEGLGLNNVYCHIGDGSLGWPDAAPYDGILVAAAAPDIPQPLLDQLKENAHLVIPVGGSGYQMMQVWTKRGDHPDCREVTPVAFVPLRGKHGWPR